MKTKLMLVSLLASASLVQAGPPITPAKVKRPLHISQIKSIFPHAEPSAPVQKTHEGASSAASATSPVVPSAETPDTGAASKKVHLNTFLNHPKTAPGPK